MKLKIRSSGERDSNQINNFNLTLRFQLRIKPVSDLFVVNRDNNIPESYKLKTVH
jgi:hypothetical protein